jgi:hypothetical protein
MPSKKKTTALATQASRSAITRASFVNQEAWRQIKEMGSELISSQALPSTIKNPAQLCMVFLAGYEYGMSAMESLNAFYIIDGKLTIYGSSVVAQLKRNGFKVQWGLCDTQEANVTIIDPEGNENIEKYTFAEAQAAGLTAKRNWVTHRKNMLRWRCVGNAVRFFCPEVLSGFYLKEEIEGEMNIDKPVIETGAVPETKIDAPALPAGEASKGDIVETKTEAPAPVETGKKLSEYWNKKIILRWAELASLSGWEAKKAADLRHATLAKFYNKTSNKDLTDAEAADFVERIGMKIADEQAKIQAGMESSEKKPICPECNQEIEKAEDKEAYDHVGVCLACANKLE